MSLVEKSLKIPCNPKLKVLLLNQEEGKRQSSRNERRNIMAIELTDREMDVLSNLLENIISKLELNDDGEWHPREMVYF